MNGGTEAMDYTNPEYPFKVQLRIDTETGALIYDGGRACYFVSLNGSKLPRFHDVMPTTGALWGWNTVYGPSHEFIDGKVFIQEYGADNNPS